MAKKKKQHFLPRVFLKGFTNESGHLFMLDREKGGIKGPRTIETVAYESHLYTVRGGNGGRDLAIEDFFGVIENEMSDLFTKIQASGFDDVTDQELNHLIEFVTLQHCRMPGYVRGAGELIHDDEFVAAFLREYGGEGAKWLLESVRHSGKMYAVMLRGLFEARLERFMHNFNFVLGEAVDGAPPFLLTDRYISLELTGDEVPYNGPDVDWGRVEAKVFFPVTARHCLCLIAKDSGDRGQATFMRNNSVISVEDVVKINYHASKQIDRYAYCTDKLVLEGVLESYSADNLLKKR